MADNEHTDYPKGGTLRERAEWYEQEATQHLLTAAKRLEWASKAPDEDQRARWVGSAEFWIRCHKRDTELAAHLRNRLRRESAWG